MLKYLIICVSYFVKREHFLKTQESTGRVSEMKTSFDVKTASWGERQGQNKVLLSDVADNTEAGLCDATARPSKLQADLRVFRGKATV